MKKKTRNSLPLTPSPALSFTPSSQPLASGTPIPLSTSEQVEAAMNPDDSAPWLLCIIEGKTEVFPIDIEGPSWHNLEFLVDDLKKKIQEE